MGETARNNSQNNLIQFGKPKNIMEVKPQQPTKTELENLIKNAIREVQTENSHKTRQPRLRNQSAYKSNGIRKPKQAEPLYSSEEFKRLGNYFLTQDKRHGRRNYMMLVFGCTVGDRRSDLLNAHIYDVVNPDGTIADYYETYEKKTGKLTKNKLTPLCKEAIRNYLKSNPNYKSTDYLIQSQKGGKMTVQQMWRILNIAGDKVGLKQNIGTHTLRKTYGYMARKANPNDSVMDTLQAKYHHSDQRITKTYLTITQNEIDDLADSVDDSLK